MLLLQGLGTAEAAVYEVKMNKKQWHIFAVAFFIIGIILSILRSIYVWVVMDDSFHIYNVTSLAFLGIAFALWYAGNTEENKK